MYGMSYINKNISHFIYWYVNQVTKRKDFKSRYFALVRLKTNSSRKLTLKDMYNMSYNQTLHFRKIVHTS